MREGEHKKIGLCYSVLHEERKELGELHIGYASYSDVRSWEVAAGAYYTDFLIRSPSF